MFDKCCARRYSVLGSPSAQGMSTSSGYNSRTRGRTLVMEQVDARTKREANEDGEEEDEDGGAEWQEPPALAPAIGSGTGLAVYVVSGRCSQYRRSVEKEEAAGELD